jgi:hypothetical protein
MHKYLLFVLLNARDTTRNGWFSKRRPDFVPQATNCLRQHDSGDHSVVWLQWMSVPLFFHNSSPRTMSSAHTSRVTKPTQRTPTCNTCRSRHQKCGGEQPRCSNYRLRGINCSYSGSKIRAPETKRSPSSTFALPFVPGVPLLAETWLTPPIDRVGHPFQMPTTTVSTQRYSATSCVTSPPSPNAHHDWYCWHRFGALI